MPKGFPNGGARSRAEYNSWHSMVYRCTNPKSIDYQDYGGRGITVCPEWLDFWRFLADVGPRPRGTTLDRIDNSKGYFPGNVQWSGAYTQQRNKRNTVLVTLNGVTKPLPEWAAERGIELEKARRRLAAGHPPELALSMNHGEHRINVKMVMYRGKLRPLPAVARELGLSRVALQSRLKKGWSIDRALSTPQLRRVREPTERCRSQAARPPTRTPAQ